MAGRASFLERQIVSAVRNSARSASTIQFAAGRNPVALRALVCRLASAIVVCTPACAKLPTKREFGTFALSSSKCTVVAINEIKCLQRSPFDKLRTCGNELRPDGEPIRASNTRPVEIHFFGAQAIVQLPDALAYLTR